MDVNTEVVANSDNVEDLLGDLVLGEGDVTDAEIIEALGADDLDAIETLNEQSAAVEAQVSTIEATTEAAEQPAKIKKTRKASSAPKEKAPKIERDLSALPDAVFQLVKDGPTDRAAVIALRPTQIKVAEKFDNLFISLAANRKPSVYTMVCFNVLADKKEVTSPDLVAAMKASASRSGAAYNEGTARSQVGQMMNLFAAVGIATRTGNKLTFNKDSQIAASLQAL